MSISYLVTVAPLPPVQGVQVAVSVHRGGRGGAVQLPGRGGAVQLPRQQPAGQAPHGHCDHSPGDRPGPTA